MQEHVSNDGVPKDDEKVEQLDTDSEVRNEVVSVDKLEILDKSNSELEKHDVTVNNENVDGIEDVDLKLEGKERTRHSKDNIVFDDEKRISKDEIKDTGEKFEKGQITLDIRNKISSVNEQEILSEAEKPEKDNHLNILPTHISNDEITKNGVKEDALIVNDEILENIRVESANDLKLEESIKTNLNDTNLIQTNDLNDPIMNKGLDYHDKTDNLDDKTSLIKKTVSVNEFVRKEPSIESFREVPDQVAREDRLLLIEINISTSEEIDMEKEIPSPNLENLEETKKQSDSTIKNQTSTKEGQELNKDTEQVKINSDFVRTKTLNEYAIVETKENVPSYSNTEVADNADKETKIYSDRKPSSFELNDNLGSGVLKIPNEMYNLDIDKKQTSEDLFPEMEILKINLDLGISDDPDTNDDLDANHRNELFGEMTEFEEIKEEVRNNSEKQEFINVEVKKPDKTTKQIKITSSVDIHRKQGTQHMVSSIKRKISVEVVKGLDPNIEACTANCSKVEEKKNKKNCVCFIQRHISINETEEISTGASAANPIYTIETLNIPSDTSSSKSNLSANKELDGKRKVFNPFSSFINKNFGQSELLKQESFLVRGGLETIIEDPDSNSFLDSHSKKDDSISIIKSVSLKYHIESDVIKYERSTDEHIDLNEVKEKVKLISNVGSIISQTFDNEIKPSVQIFVKNNQEESAIKEQRKYAENQDSENVDLLEKHVDYEERTLDTNIDITAPIEEDELIINSLCRDLRDKPIVVSSELLLYEMSPVIIIEDFDKIKAEIQTIPSIESMLHQIDANEDLKLPILFEKCSSSNKIISLKVENVLRSLENEFDRNDVFSDNMLEIEQSMSPDNITMDYYHRDDLDNFKVNRAEKIDRESNEFKTTLTDVQPKLQNKIPIETNGMQSSQSLRNKRSGKTNKLVDKHQKRFIKDNESSKTIKSLMSLETYNTIAPNIDRQYLLHSRLCDVKYKVINHDIFSNASLSSMNRLTKRSSRSNQSEVSCIDKQDYIQPLSSNYKNASLVVDEKSKGIQEEKCKVFSRIDSNLFDNADFGVNKLDGEKPNLLNEFGNTFQIHNSIQNQAMSCNDQKSEIDSFYSTHSIDVRSETLDGQRSRVTVSTSVSSNMISVKSAKGSSNQNDAMIDSDSSSKTSNHNENYTINGSKSNRNNRTDDSIGKVTDRTSSKSRASGQSPNTNSEHPKVNVSITDRENGSKKYVLMENEADDENHLLKPMVDLDIQFGAHKHCSEEKYQRIDKSCYDNLALSIAIKYSNSICSNLNPEKQEMCFNNLRLSEKSPSPENKPLTNYAVSNNENESDKTSAHPHGFERDQKHKIENPSSHKEIPGPDKQFFFHKTLSADRFQSIDNATFTKITLSTIKRPPEMNDFLPDNLSTDSTLSSQKYDQTLHSCKDINKVTAELKIHDDKLKKLVYDIERLDNPTICDPPMKEFEDKLIDESKSYREWKHLNDPNSFDKEEFLLDVSVSVRKEIEDFASGRFKNLYSLDEINGIVSELDLNDVTLRKLIRDIEFENDAGMSKTLLQELEIKLTNESKSYAEWKQRNKPSSLVNEHFLLELSSRIRILMFGSATQPNKDTLNATLQFLPPFQKEDVVSLDNTTTLHSIDRIFSTSRERDIDDKKINLIEKRYSVTDIDDVISDLKLNDDELIQLVHDIKTDNQNIARESTRQLEDKLTDESRYYREWKNDKKPSQFDVHEFLVDLSSRIRELLSENEDRICEQKLDKGSRYSEISIHIEKSPSLSYVVTMNDSESIIDLKYRETDGFKIIELNVYKETSCEELASINVPNTTNETESRYIPEGQISRKDKDMTDNKADPSDESINDREQLAISSNTKDQIFNDKYPLSEIQESYAQITSTNDLENNIETSSIELQIPYSLKDIQAVIADLRREDKELNKLIGEIQASESKTSLEISLKALDRKLLDESKSYQDWKILNEPSAFDNEQFLIDLSSFFRKLIPDNDRQTTPISNQDTTTDQQLTKRIKHTDLPIYIDTSPIRYELSKNEESVVNDTDDQKINKTSKDGESHINKVLFELNMKDPELKNLVHDIKETEEDEGNLKPLLQELDNKLKRESISYREWKTQAKPSSFDTDIFLLDITSEVHKLVKDLEISYTNKDIRNVVSDLKLKDSELNDLVQAITHAESGSGLKPLIQELDDKLKRESVSYRDWTTLTKPSSIEAEQFVLAVSSEIQNLISNQSVSLKNHETSFSSKNIRNVVSELNLQDPELKVLTHDIQEIEDGVDLKPMLNELDNKLKRESVSYRELKAEGKLSSFETEQFLIEVSSEIHNLISENQLSTTEGVKQPADVKIQNQIEIESHLSIIDEKSPSVRCILSIIQSESILAVSPKISEISSNKEMQMKTITVDENIIKQMSISISVSKTDYQSNEDIKSQEKTQPPLDKTYLTINDSSNIITKAIEANDRKETTKDKSLSQNDSQIEMVFIPLENQSIEPSILLAENEIVSFNGQLSPQNSSLSHTEISLEIVQNGTQIAMIAHEFSSQGLQSNVSISESLKNQAISNKLPVFDEVSMGLSHEIGILDNTDSKLTLSTHAVSESVQDELGITVALEQSRAIKKRNRTTQLVNENIHRESNLDQDLIDSTSLNKDLGTFTNTTTLELSILNAQDIVDRDKKPPLAPREEIMTMQLSIEKDSNSTVKSVSITMESSQIRRQPTSNTITDEQQALLDEANRDRLAKEFEKNIEDKLFDDLLEFLIDSCLDVILAEKSAGDDCRKPDSCISYSFDNDQSEKFPGCPDLPIIDYETHVCLNSKVPVKISRHEEHSHLKLYKSDNNKDEYRLSAKSYKRTDMILPKCNQKISKDFKKQSVKLGKQIPSLNCKKGKTGLPLRPPKVLTDIHITSSSDGETSDYESVIPTIYQKNITSETHVKYDQAAKWMDLPKKSKDCIRTPYGYYKTEYNCYKLPLPPQSFKKQKSSGSQNEFVIPNDGIFGRDFTEPKFTNFCCNNCRAWINLGDRPKHHEECKGFNQNSNDSARPKIKPRSIKRMPGIVCYICGKRFTKHSIKIHEKSCLILWNKINCSFKKILRKPIPEKPAVGEGEIQKMINDHKAQGKLDYCAEDALNELYFISSRNHVFDLNE